MHPYHYNRYYDQLCEFCENEMVSQEERFEEGGECKQCKKTMCEDCREGEQCTECGETVCVGCVGYCQFCNDSRFCEDCLAEHQQQCTRLTRAERKLETLTESLESKELEKARLKRRLAELGQEIEDIHAQKADAERKIKKIRRRGN